MRQGSAARWVGLESRRRHGTRGVLPMASTANVFFIDMHNDSMRWASLWMWDVLGGIFGLLILDNFLSKGWRNRFIIEFYYTYIEVSHSPHTGYFKIFLLSWSPSTHVRGVYIEMSILIYKQHFPSSLYFNSI